MPLVSNILSLNSCFGIAIYIYCQILLFKELIKCDCTEPDKLVAQTWLIIEISTFYISIVMSVIIMIMMCFNEERKRPIRYQAANELNDDAF